MTAELEKVAETGVQAACVSVEALTHFQYRHWKVCHPRPDPQEIEEVSKKQKPTMEEHTDHSEKCYEVYYVEIVEGMSPLFVDAAGMAFFCL